MLTTCARVCATGIRRRSLRERTASRRWVAGLLCVVVPCLAAVGGETAARPNIVLIMADDMGYNRILTQAEDIAPDFPFHVFFAMEDYIAENPNTLRAVLRGFVRGVRLAKADRERSIEELMDRIPVPV